MSFSLAAIDSSRRSESIFANDLHFQSHSANSDDRSQELADGTAFTGVFQVAGDSPMTITDMIALAAFAVGGALSAWLLRQAWQRRSGALACMCAAWLILFIVLAAAAVVMGSARGPFAAAMVATVAAMAVIATGIKMRPAREAAERLALEPSERPSRIWRGVLRALLAGPIGGIAAMGVAIAWTVWLPADPQTRIVTGGLLQPVLWGAGMAWTLSDDKILRATAVLLGVAIVTFTASALKGFG
jgi:hypothetical protein